MYALNANYQQKIHLLKTNINFISFEMLNANNYERSESR